MYAFKRILVPSDFSACSTKALGAAITLAVRLEAELFLLYVETGAPGSKTWMSNEATKAEIDALEGDERRAKGPEGGWEGRVTVVSNY